ncbi:putative uncharacterized protein DDB_G0286751 [Chenopodium quinoa]|uniref:putative uncharacterized protein DDB_G0286751 n=1 Tax=Chenopodium quinoa TaxID=63459 RepID=UPI000B76E2CD|nr:putative uncharacterized protein DDB_G0286751 [Chenopodium quinoa]
MHGRAAHLYALEVKKKKELANVQVKEKRKEVGQNSGNQQGNQNNFKKRNYHHNNNNFHNNNNNNNNNFQGNNRQGGRNFNGGARNNDQGNNIIKRCYFSRDARITTLERIVKEILLLVVLATSWDIENTSVSPKVLMGIRKTTI